MGVGLVAEAQEGCTPKVLPWSESFDSYGVGATLMPPCWSGSHNYDIGAVPHVDSAVRYDGTASLMLYSGTLTGSHYSMAIGPEIDADLTSGVYARFQFYALSTSVALEVGVCNDTNRYTRNFVPLDTVHVDQGRHWKEVVIDLSRYSGTGRRLAFRLQRTLQADVCNCYIDNLRVEGCGTTVPEVYHITHNSLTVDWERFGIGTILLEYNDMAIDDAVAPLTLTGLTPLTEYTLSTGCADGTRQAVTISTLAAPSLQPTYYHAQLTLAGDSTPEVLPLPLESIDIGQLTIALRYRGNSSTRLQVGVMEYALEAETFTALDTLTPGSGWQRATVPLAPYTGTGRYLALMATGGHSVEIADLRVARCLIDSVRLYDLTDASVAVAWDTLTVGVGGGVTIEYGVPGFAAGSGTTVTPTTNPFILTGLLPSTEYDLLVMPSCGDKPSAFDRHRITTFSHEVSAPYCMSFEGGGTLPQGWVCGQGSVAIGSNAYEGSHGLHLAAHSLVALPRIATDTGATVVVECYSYGTGTLELGFMENPFGTFTPFDTLTGGSGWRRQLTTAVVPEGQLLALRSNTAWDIDALAVHGDAVTSLSIDSIGKTSARVSWQTLLGDSVEIEYAAVTSATADFTPGTGIALQGKDSLTLDGLTPGTFYAVHLRPVGDGQGCLYQSCHLQTAAGPTAVPYCENFDNLSALPTGWRRKSDYGEYPIVSTERNHSPSKGLRFSATASAKTVALLPDFVSESEHLTMAFWTNVTLNPQGAMLLVGHLRNITDINSFVPFDTITFSQTERWEHHVVDLGTAHEQTALMLVGGGSGETRVFIDDLCVESCLADEIRVSSVDSSSLSVYWNSRGVAAMDITLSGNGENVRDTFSLSPAYITDIEPNTSYTLVFRALCDCGDNGGAHLVGYGSDGEVAQDQITQLSIQTIPPYVNAPFCTSFEQENTGMFPYNWGRSRTIARVSDRNYHDGSHSLLVEDSCYLMLPPMRNIPTLTASLHAYATSEAGLGEGVIVLGVMRYRDTLASFTAVDTLTLTRPGEWQRLWGDLAGYDGNGRFITLKIKANGSCTFFLDDFSIAASAIGEATVDDTGLVSWEGLHAPTMVAIEYGTQGFPRGSGQQDTVAAPPYPLPNLVAGENYDIYLTPITDTTPSCMATQLTLGALATTPYCEQFESAPLSGMPMGWSMGRTYGGTPAIAAGDNRSLQLRGHAAATNRSIAVLPLLQISDTMQLNISLRASNANARLVVGHIGENADPNTFVATDTLEASTLWRRVAVLVDPPQGRRLAVSCFSINQNDAQVWIDSLAVTRGLSPTLEATSARTLTFSGANGFYEYGPAGFMQGGGTLVHVTTDTLEISGLTPESSYWFYSREDSLTLTCMPPAKIRMPAEAALPYCQGDTTFERLQLPEMSIDSIRHLYLYLTTGEAGRIVVGVMEHDGDWEHLTAVDTLEAEGGIRQLHTILLDTYTENGRFVGLLSPTGSVAVESLTATRCPWVTFEEGNDNSVTITGNGQAEYGPEGFAPGSGTTVTVTGSLTLPLADTQRYDFYPLCGSETPCYAPVRWQSTMTVALPYCVTFGNSLPNGWTSRSNALDDNAVSVGDSTLTLRAAPRREVVVRLPVMQEHDVVTEMDVKVSSTDAKLLLGGDTVETIPGEWRHVRMRTLHEGRLTLRAVGDGTIEIRKLHVERCSLPLSVTVGQPGGRGVEIGWDTTGVSGPFFIEYRLTGSDNGIIMRAEEPPLALQLLPDTSYQLYLRCDSIGSSCREPLTISTLSDPITLPYCTAFNLTDHHHAPEGWYLASDNEHSYFVMPQFDTTLQSLNILILAKMQYGGQTLTLGSMADAGNPETFDSLVTFVADGDGENRFFHSLSHYYGNGRFLALRPNGEGWVHVEHLSVDTCAAYNIAITENESNHLILEWEQQGAPTVSVEYGPIGFVPGQGTLLTADTSPLRIDSLVPLTDYAFIVSSLCSETSCRVAVTDTFLTFTPKGGTGCIDYTDLHASYVICNYGSYDNPTAYTGVIDKGFLSAASRHTVHFDTTERDPRTGNLLRTVPPGEQASVRLGNWSTNINPQAESITYALAVDTNDFNLLVLRYAAVLQDPEHSPALQPRFRLQILNQSYDIINECSSADFIANPNLNWNIAANEVLWKDWTTVGVDLSTYAGQTIFIRLITNDCGEGSHFGYAYFTLGCSTKRMRTEGCSEVPNNRFTVPSGFNYRWYTNLDTTTLSDSASIWVPSDNSKIYYCNLSFIDNPACSFTMSAFAGARFPLAIIDTSLSLADCAFDLTLIDHSTISGDGITPIGTGESCETTLWLLPDSTTSDATSLTLHITDTGSYDIGLVAGIADDQCLDTVRHTIHIAYPYPAVTLEGRDERCFDDPAEVLALSHAALSDWEGHLLEITPLADTTVIVSATDSNGCEQTFSHTLVVHPIFFIEDSAAVCSSNLSYTWRDTTLTFTIADTAISATLHRQTAHGCDSTMTLVLTLWPSYDIHHTDTLCDNQTLDFFDTVLNTTGDYLHPDTTLLGCDSLVTMHLKVMPTYLVPDSLVACDSLRWQDGTLYTADTTGALHLLPTMHGCDSTMELHLTIHPSYHQHYMDSVCNSMGTYVWLDTLLTLDPSVADLTATLSRQTIHQCDSIHTLGLTLMPTYDIHHHDTLCHDRQLPFFDTILATTGDYLHTDSTAFGCDSLVTMHLEIIPRFFGNDSLVVCDSLTWINDVTYYRDTAEVSDTLLTLRGCDSVRTLYLTVNHSYSDLVIDTFCQGTEYQFREHTLTEGGHYADTLQTLKGCDSVLAIDLTRLATPQISITHGYDCDSLYHHLEAHSDVPYIQWSSDPYDSLLDGHEGDFFIDAKPKSRTVYTLYADYADVPHCPVTTSVTLAPAVKPLAKMRVSPLALVLPATEFDAYDISAEYQERAWYVNDLLQSETSRHLQGNVPTDRDTAKITLIVDDGYCTDTAITLIPLLFDKFVAPNAFTPDREDNNLFFFRGTGILEVEIRIYNRRGMLVFYSTDFGQPWDGRNIDGTPCPTGNYIWNLRYTAVTHPHAFREETGSVLLIR